MGFCQQLKLVFLAITVGIPFASGKKSCNRHLLGCHPSRGKLGNPRGLNEGLYPLHRKHTKNPGKSSFFNRKTMRKPWENGDLYGKIHHLNGKINYFYGPWLPVRYLYGYYIGRVTINHEPQIIHHINHGLTICRWFTQSQTIDRGNLWLEFIEFITCSNDDTMAMYHNWMGDFTDVTAGFCSWILTYDHGRIHVRGL